MRERCQKLIALVFFVMVLVPLFCHKILSNYIFYSRVLNYANDKLVLVMSTVEDQVG